MRIRYLSSYGFSSVLKAVVIVSRMTRDVDSLSELVQMGLLMFVSNGLLLTVSIVVLAVVSWKLLLLCLICVPAVVLASIKFQRDSNVAYLDVRDGIGATLSHLQEGIAGVRVDRKSVVWGKGLSVRLDLVGRRLLKNKKYKNKSDNDNSKT